MNNLLNHSKLFLKRNSATILTCVGGAGVVATAVLTAKATPKAKLLLEQAKEEKGEDLTKFETVIAAGPAYIPAIVTCATTLVCIFGANALNKKQQASLMSAYALLDNSYKAYKNKVSELYGEDGVKLVREEIAKDDYAEIADDIHVEDDKKLFYDEYSGRYFNSTMEDVQRAEYNLNRDIVMRGYAYVNEFYEHLGIEPIDGGWDLGWSQGALLACYWQEWLDFSHTKVVMDDGLECHIVTMFQEPLIDFDYY